MKYVNESILMVALILLAGCSHAPVLHTPATTINENTTSATPKDGTDLNTVNADRADPEILKQYQRTLSLMADEKFTAAENILQNIIAEDPNLAGPYVNLGIIYQKTDKDTEAEHAFELAIEHNPDNVIARNQLGILYRKNGRFDDARKMYDMALKIDPQYATAHLNLGILYDLYLNQPQLALTHYQRYLQLNKAEDKQVELWVADLKNRGDQPTAQNAGGVP
jgi:tetratricopeptide (TPR) repeat protein